MLWTLIELAEEVGAMSRAQHEEEPRVPWVVRWLRVAYDELPWPGRWLVVLTMIHGLQLVGILPHIPMPPEFITHL